MTLLTALIGHSIKLRWKLSLQVQSKGAVRRIATDYYGPSKEGEPARIRAYASYDDFFDLYWDLNRRLKGVLDDHGIEIPFPQRVIHYPNNEYPDNRPGTAKG